MTIRFPLPLLLAAALVPSAPRLALAATPSEIVAAKRALRSAVNSAKPDSLLAVRGRFAALAAAEPGNARLEYWTAVAAWRAIPLVMSRDKDAALKLADDGIARCDRALEADPKFAEALAVKGGLQGMSISLRPGAMMTLGPESGANISRALGMQPDNPRVRLLEAIGTYNKPAMFGGGPGKALPQLRATIDAFAKDAPADSTAPDWGRADAWVWTGRALEAQNKLDEARAAYRQALALEPDYAWASHVLLPGVEKRLAQAEK